MNVNEIVAALATTRLTDNDRWMLQRALDTCPPADEHAARRLLKDRVHAWVQSQFTPVNIDALRRHEAWENGLDYITDDCDHQRYVEEEHDTEYERWCKDNDKDPESSHLEYVEMESLEDRFDEWRDAGREIIWNTLFTTDSELLADALRDTGCAVIDGTPFDLDTYVIGFTGAGYSFYASHWIPAYLSVVDGEREFFTIDGKLVNYSGL